MNEVMAASLPNSGDVHGGVCQVSPEEAESIKHRVDEILQRVDTLEQKLQEVEQFYSSVGETVNQLNLSSPSTAGKDKEKGRHVLGVRKLQQEAARREAVAAKRMQDLMRQFGTIFRQITQHKWAWPFMHPVDVEGLGLHDYYEIIDKPMDFSTIKNQMEAKDGTGYKHVMQIYTDMKLVFENAMKYNEEKSDVYSMAKTLLEKFEEKWAQFLPKVKEEEKRREEDKNQAELEMQLAKEASHAKITREINNEICDVDAELEELRSMVVQKCRKISIEERRDIGLSMPKLSPDNLLKALDILAQGNPSFQTTEAVVNVEMDTLDEPTLWRLKIFVKDALEDQKKKTSIGVDHRSKDIERGIRTKNEKCKGGGNKRKRGEL
ncbi:PREDICTED: transcription factor GTE6 [Tarenaya hassleriana]|uniref:transcription factor GTE6 n=1 Tax=Tarenaya hassleriana TaxID=28532 RepID=UPI00053C4949|nr:PREDICTED: transcription factor GTE6 [Tarenaya hassleriana]